MHNSEARETKLSLALCQILCVSDKSVNVSTARSSVESAVQLGAQMVMLPEMFNCPYSNDSFGPFSEFLPVNIPCTQQELQEMAAERK